MTDDLHQKKQELRRTMQSRRADAFRENPNAGEVLRDLFEKSIALPPGAVVAGYCPRGNEMNPSATMETLRARRHPIALPAVVAKGKPLVFRLHRPDDKLIPGVMDIPEPIPEAPVADPDVLLVPLLAFDRKGGRLGYGGGYYDRTLATLRLHKHVLAVGIAYACQEVPEVPSSPADARLDRIVTETGLVIC